MRSLYTDDIPGAKPTIRYYDKSLIRYRHEEEIARFGNKNKRICHYLRKQITRFFWLHSYISLS